MTEFGPLTIIRLAGSPYERGFKQAEASDLARIEVPEIIAERYDAAHGVLGSPRARDYLARQRSFAERFSIPELQEFAGVCEGFGMDQERAFALFHLSILSHDYEIDGCTAWARTLPDGGAVLVKNRDLSGPHRAHQAVFLHDDPAAHVGRVLCLGTLGAPGAYSSGMNEMGLAIADTAISAPRHGVGWLRYFLMTRLLFTCADVAEALALISAQRHAGGGSLILADRSGAAASVELFADSARIDRTSPAYRTNHFTAEPLEGVAFRTSPEGFRSTTGRMDHLRRRLGAGLGLNGFGEIAAAMADHGDDAGEGFCRHGRTDPSCTVSTVVYSTWDAVFRLADGPPCETPWRGGRPFAEGAP